VKQARQALSKAETEKRQLQEKLTDLEKVNKYFFGVFCTFLYFFCGFKHHLYLLYSQHSLEGYKVHVLVYYRILCSAPLLISVCVYAQ